jgi:cyclic pyranopterin phosphate synthase
LTAACNYACEYCVPNGKRLVAAQDELSAEQMIRAVELLVAAAGIEKLRITGGEPLVSPKFDAFLPAVMQLPLRDVSITTNGQLLERKAELILGSGVKRLNVSLDTLNPVAFSKIARGGDLATVLRGIERMHAAGVRLKINMVPMRHANLDQVLPLLEFSLEREIELRFIELMNMGHLKRSPEHGRQFVGQAELLDIIGTRYEYTRTDAAYDSTSVRYEIPGVGTFGIIANESEPFCAACTRLRLSSNGYLYGCLSSASRHYIADVLESPEHVALPRLQNLLVRALGDKQPASFRGEVTVMKFIGG